MDKIPMTRAGVEALEKELRKRLNETRPEIIQAIAEARAHGDLSENAEYHAAREKQSFNEGRIKELEAVISAADIIGALEGPIAITECSDESHDGCVRQDHCEVSGHWPRINQAIHAALQSISLLEMSRPDPLQLLHFHPLHQAMTTQVTGRLI